MARSLTGTLGSPEDSTGCPGRRVPLRLAGTVELLLIPDGARLRRERALARPRPHLGPDRFTEAGSPSQGFPVRRPHHVAS